LTWASSPISPRQKWKLVIDGQVESPVTLSWDDFMALPQTEDTSDFHCVTTWSRMDVPWKGVRLADLAALGAHPSPQRRIFYAMGMINTPPIFRWQEALKEDVLLVHTADNKPLERDHGGPVRMITPQLYAWKGSKWISRIEFLPFNKLGFWELRGYSSTAYPWRNDRYS
jgi:DMSO/TMAO reductase YedYZ molybdopterin-dependent catalytic subunit